MLATLPAHAANSARPALVNTAVVIDLPIVTVPRNNFPGKEGSVFTTLPTHLAVDLASDQAAACTYLNLLTIADAFAACAASDAALPACPAFATALNSPAPIKKEAIFHNALPTVLQVLCFHSSADQTRKVAIAAHASPAGVSPNPTKVHNPTNVSTGCSIMVATPSRSQAAASTTHAAG